jgi:hypothetical protein
MVFGIDTELKKTGTVSSFTSGVTSSHKPFLTSLTCWGYTKAPPVRIIAIAAIDMRTTKNFAVFPGSLVIWINSSE